MDKAGRDTLLTMEKSAGWYNNWLFSLVANKIEGDVLEIGAGVGTFTNVLAKKGNVTAIDINETYIKKLKDEYPPVIKVGFGDIEKNTFFFKSRKFNTVICFNVLEHIKNHKKAVKNMHDLLKREGRLILLVPAHKSLYSNFDRNLGHYRRYDKKGLVKIMKDAGFSSVDSRFLNWWGAVGWFLIFKFFGLLKMPEREISIFDRLGRLFLLPENFIKFPFGLSVLAIGRK
jgi:SAM-dependent methyltransferase